jgi:hypothetical protein
MKIVLFEDDARTAARITSAVKKLLKSGDVVVHFQPSKNVSIAEISLYEDRLVAEAKEPAYKGATLWVTDRDLSQTADYRGLSEVTVSKVADRLGIAICKYAQGTTDSVFERQRDWGDAQIIIDRSDITEMARRIVMLARGFDQISKALKPLLGGIGKKLRTPAAVMATVLGRPEAADRIALYASGDQKMVGEILPFAAKPNKAVLASRLPSLFGYWLFDSILRFPGLVVNGVAAASYLNISVADFKKPSVRALFADALYEGPFADLADPHWWRSDLDKIVDLAGVPDGRQLVKARLKKSVGPCLDKGKRAGWYCMVKKVPVSEENSVGNISWFPPGADLARVRKDVFEEAGPWLGLY